MEGSIGRLVVPAGDELLANIGLLVGVGFLLCAASLGWGVATVGAQEGPPPLDNTTDVYTGDRVDGVEAINDLVRTDDGGVLAVQVRMTSPDSSRSVILRLDESGTVVNEEPVDGNLRTISRVGEDSYAAAGLKDDDAFMTRIGPDGTVSWSKTFGGEGRDIGLDVVSAPNGEAYLLASTESFGVETSDLWVTRVDADGESVWDRLVEHESWTAFPKGERLQDGSLIATIRTKRSMDKSVDGKQNVSVVRLEPDGSVTWRTVISGQGQPQDKEEMFDVIPAHGDGVLIAGASNTGNEKSRNFDVWAARVLSDGEVSWQQQYESGVRTFVTDAVRMEGGYLLAGFTDPQDDPKTGMVMGISEDGDAFGQSVYDRSDEFEETVGGIEWTSDGQLYLGGFSANEDNGNMASQAWIVDVTAGLPVKSSPSAWETQHGESDTGADTSDTNSGEGESNSGSAVGSVNVADSSMDAVLYGATVLASVALLVPYGLRRVGRH